VETNHFSKQQCADMYEFSVVYKVYFVKLYSLSASMYQPRIFGRYITFCSKLCCSEIISIYIWHFDRWPLLSMKHDNYYVIGRQGNAVIT